VPAGRAGKIGARHDHQAVTEERSSDQAFVGIWIDTDNQIVAFLDHIDGPVLTRHLKPHLRIFESKACGNPAHRGLGKMQRCADPQSPLGPLTARGNRRSRLVQFGEQRPRPLEQRPSFLGEFQVTRTPFKQPQIETAFQLGDTPGQGRLGPTGGAGRFAEAAMTRHEVEISKCEKIHECSICETDCPK